MCKISKLHNEEKTLSNSGIEETGYSEKNVIGALSHTTYKNLLQEDYERKYKPEAKATRRNHRESSRPLTWAFSSSSCFVWIFHKTPKASIKKVKIEMRVHQAKELLCDDILRNTRDAVMPFTLIVT